jgi:hypothetical protein
MFKRLIDAICFRLINGPLGGPSPVEFRISKMDLKPGDFIVVRFRRALSGKQVDCLRESLKGVLPDNKILVFEGEVDLAVLSKPLELVKAA